MPIVSYLRATLCNSSIAAYNLAVDSPKYANLAKSIISAKNSRAKLKLQSFNKVQHHSPLSRAYLKQSKENKVANEIKKYDSFLKGLSEINVKHDFANELTVSSSWKNVHWNRMNVTDIKNQQPMRENAALTKGLSIPVLVWTENVPKSSLNV
ncbi:hypothetical protein O3W44_13445 [Pantoea sp. LMR881]|uniref:hypothetical protein n=1 Tax=Pantoea sp. LMR881 TaxID=3014336 RepID=UPI0022AEB02D|nr:hypothetical protein [Pantoea sp. LMR881]MCZ4059872.1 hypothetical protein [Pantoea sp. LMR881]